MQSQNFHPPLCVVWVFSKNLPVTIHPSRSFWSPCRFFTFSMALPSPFMWISLMVFQLGPILFCCWSDSFSFLCHHFSSYWFSWAKFVLSACREFVVGSFKCRPCQWFFLMEVFREVLLCPVWINCRQNYQNGLVFTLSSVIFYLFRVSWSQILLVFCLFLGLSFLRRLQSMIYFSFSFFLYPYFQAICTCTQVDFWGFWTGLNRIPRTIHKFEAQ